MKRLTSLFYRLFYFQLDLDKNNVQIAVGYCAPIESDNG